MKKILIVDDDVDIIDLVENRLRQNGYDVTFAKDGGSGVQKALLEKPDLVIMDIMMPHMHGGEAVKLLKSYEETKDIPVLFFTAMNSYLPNDSDLQQINVDGKFYPSLAKPFEPARLLACIKALLGE